MGTTYTNYAYDVNLKHPGLKDTMLSKNLTAFFTELLVICKNTPAFKIKCQKVSSEVYKIEFTKIESDGPVICFGPALVDIPSMNTIIYTHKSNTGYVTTSLAEQFGARGVTLTPELLAYSLEEYKLGRTSLSEMASLFSTPSTSQLGDICSISSKVMESIFGDANQNTNTFVLS